MSKKLRIVEIEAFRAYEKLQTFDFQQQDGNIANLIVIYAPNGYGKTSFFDAIEWAITGEIARFKSTIAIKQEVSLGEGLILKNRNSVIDSGRVKLIDENNNCFEVKTKVLKGKMKNDYKVGDISPIPEPLIGLLNEKASFCTTNLLAHDKITSFLQNSKAEDKTKALQPFWDTDKYADILDQVVELADEISKTQKALKEKLHTQDRELKEYKFEKEEKRKIEAKIMDFNSKKENNCFYYNDLLEDIESVQKDVFNMLEELQREKENLEEQWNSSELLLKDVERIFVIDRNIKERQDRQSEHQKKLEVFGKVEDLESNLNKNILEMNRYEKALNEWPSFFSIENNIQLKSNSLKQLIKQKLEIEQKLFNANENMDRLKVLVKADKLKLEKNKLEIIQFRSAHIEYERNQIIIRKYNRIVPKADYLIKCRIKFRNALNNELENLKLFRDNRNIYDNIEGLLTDEQKGLYIEQSNLEEEIKVLEKNLYTFEDNYNKMLDLSDKLNQIIAKGKEVISIEKTSECPLCHAKYHDFNELLERTSTNKNEEKLLEGLQKQILDTKKVLEYNKEKLKGKVTQFLSLIDDILDKYSKRYLDQNIKIQKLQTERSMWQENLNEAIEKVERLNDEYLTKNISLSDVTEVKAFEQLLDSDKEVIEKEIREQEQKVIETEKLILACESGLKEVTLYSTQIAGEVNALKNEDIYINMKEFLELKNYSIDPQKLNQLYEALQLDLNEFSDRKEDLKQEILDFKKGLDIPKETLLQEYRNNILQIDELVTEKKSFLLKCKKVLGDENNENIEQRLREINKTAYDEAAQKRTQISELSNILSSLNGLKEQKIWLEKKEEREKTNRKLDQVSKKLGKLEHSKKIVQDYIVERTNEYFNSNIINQIYNKIDPHPTMNHIKFQTQSGGGTLQTRIFTYDSNEKDKMSPVLYLSSAQVNILSLCIFLAKVLTEKNRVLNTIFMDDPIQHLDGINLLAFIDLLRTITTEMDRQIIISTHNEHFYKLMRVKMDDRFYSSKFIQLNCVGEIEKENVY